MNEIKCPLSGGHLNFFHVLHVYISLNPSDLFSNEI